MLLIDIGLRPRPPLLPPRILRRLRPVMPPRIEMRNPIPIYKRRRIVFFPGAARSTGRRT